MNDQSEWRLRFAFGQIVATPGALALLDRAQISGLTLLLRHGTGDYGEMCAEDMAANERAISEGTRIMSAYEVAGEKLWIITEADRSVTTLLLPEEY